MAYYEENGLLMDEVWSNLTPEEYIEQMFIHTDTDGILYIPGWHYTRPGWENNVPGSSDEDYSYRCRMDWTMRDQDHMVAAFTRLYNQLKRIASAYTNMYLTEEEMQAALKDPELLEVWKKYLAPLDCGDVDCDKIRDIEDRLATEGWIKMLASNVAAGKPLDEYEKAALIEYLDVAVSDREKAYYRQYKNNICKDADRRIGGKLCAYEVVAYARRLCRLMCLKAPKIIIDNEAIHLAAAMTVNRYGISRDLVDNNLRFRHEMVDLYSDDYLDSGENLPKTNSAKSMVPLFVFLILAEKSSPEKHMRQQDILRELENTYEVFIERKALSRIIHGLANSHLPICADKKTGVWYAQK